MACLVCLAGVRLGFRDQDFSAHTIDLRTQRLAKQFAADSDNIVIQVEAAAKLQLIACEAPDPAWRPSSRHAAAQPHR